jgi:hypothetical protein
MSRSAEAVGGRRVAEGLVGEDGPSLGPNQAAQDCGEHDEARGQRRQHEEESAREQREEAGQRGNRRDGEALHGHQQARVGLPGELDVLREASSGGRVGQTAGCRGGRGPADGARDDALHQLVPQRLDQPGEAPVDLPGRPAAGDHAGGEHPERREPHDRPAPEEPVVDGLRDQ